MNRYMATCVPGAEPVLADEIAEKIQDKNNVYFERGRVFFDSLLQHGDLAYLQCADNIYRLIGKFKVGLHKKDLKDFYNYITRMDYSGIYNGHKLKIAVSAGRSGKHTFSRFDLSETAANAMASTGLFEIAEDKNHDLAFRIDVSDNACRFYVQLTPPEFKFRSGCFLSAKGGIRPTVAHCLVRLSLPKNADVFYDPFCGAGTIPFERAAYKYKKIFASDIDETALETASNNLGNDIILFKADAASTMLKSGSVDTVVTNMPWGKQIAPPDMEGLYHGFTAQLKRILKPSGTAVILTNQYELIQNACVAAGLLLTHTHSLSLHGLHPFVFTIKKEI